METKEQLIREIELLKKDMDISSFKVSMNLEHKMQSLIDNGFYGLIDNIEKEGLERLVATRDLLLIIKLGEFESTEIYHVK